MKPGVFYENCFHSAERCWARLQWERQSIVSGDLRDPSVVQECESGASDWEPETVSIHAGSGWNNGPLHPEVLVPPRWALWSLLRAGSQQHQRENQAAFLWTGQEFTDCWEQIGMGMCVLISPGIFHHTQCELCSCCWQVLKLYIRYELTDSDLVEVQNVNCLLKDGKEMYIQKDHLTNKLDICRCVSEATVSSCYRFPHCLDVMATPLSDLGQWANASLKMTSSLYDNKSVPSEGFAVC